MTATTQLAVETEMGPESPEAEEERLVLTNPEARAAVDAYVAAVSGPIDPEAEAAAIANLRLVQPALLVEELTTAFDQSSMIQRWLILLIMTQAPSPDVLAFATNFLHVTVPDAYEQYVLDTGNEEYDEGLAEGARLVYQAVRILHRCVETGVPGADTALLAVAVEHPLPPVRVPAIHAIEVVGDEELRAALRMAIQPADEVWLDPVPMPHAELVDIDPNDPALSDEGEPELP
ncbi:MAG: hypothetical protein KC731_20465 [Myxococcales bacterium]|nr:hypothetical protein [Myxococcales bacterium]